MSSMPVPARRTIALFSLFVALAWGTGVLHDLHGRPTTHEVPGKRVGAPGEKRPSTTLGLPGSSGDEGTVTPLPPHLDVRTIGAQADGVTDDSAALQRAIDDAATTGVAVYLPAGSYLISEALRYGEQTVLIGDGMDRTMIVTSTTRSGETPMLVPSRSGLEGVAVRDMTFDQRSDWYDRDGESKHAFLMDVSGTIGMTVERVGFRRVRTLAVYSDTTHRHETVGLHVADSHVFESNGGGFSWFGSFRDFTIERNTIEHTKDDAIAVQDLVSGDFPSNIRITDNTVIDCVERTDFGSTPNGILVFGADQVVVDGNTILGVLSNGIRVGGGAKRRGTNVTVSHNLVRDAGTNGSSDVPGYGIFIIAADAIRLEGNQIESSDDGDVHVVDSTDVSGV